MAITYSPTFAVPSAWRGLTSLFGMGRGGSPALSPPCFLGLLSRSRSLVRPCRGRATATRCDAVWRNHCSGTQTFVKRPLAGCSLVEVLNLSNGSLCLFVFVRRWRALCAHACRTLSFQEWLRAISTARLRTSPPLHLPPIYVVVFNGPIMETSSCGWLRA